ncbi:IDEAL domain-containing protein [Sporosarcina pasteurii]|uniref:Uncharacterized conserved protein n=1 Tax=Sporosarcina pasteurii TaxID=1474 RepID=A0A380CBA2_SPOPA|nr:IDEAL domain-containing protein [Sporosarcina pasteurii]MDS9472676.1 IDEAL domain-containing protein [Sporosarcina pasteurii]QBQ04336.1 IDEAL domain-containing protein [Sporosarcina pasteurii]SUJ15875.1 Uncharacterized conserved protein [Sporosarcina pasteurii]
MERKYSNAEFMKVVGRRRSSVYAEKLLNEIYMDMFLNRLHREQTRRRIEKVIDEALDTRDEQKFHLYAGKLFDFREVK